MKAKMKLSKTKAICAVAALVTLAPVVHAMDIEARGVGTATISGDVNSVRTSALRQAKRNAVLAALDKVVGAGTSRNPDVQAKLDDLVVQVRWVASMR
jgi:hypothetical protein